MNDFVQFLPLITIVGLAFLWFRNFRKKNASKVASNIEEHRVINSGTGLSAMQGLESDAWEGSMWEAESSSPVRAELKLKYKDGNDQETERVVTVRQFSPEYMGGFILGVCHLRNGTRTFRTDRIISCMDMETGEFIQDVKTYLKRGYEKSTDYSLNQILESDYDVMRVLLYVGKADGSFRKAEKEIVAQVCCQLSNDSRITPELVGEVMNRYVDVPTLMAFKQAIGRISKLDRTYQELVLDATKRMIATQKTVHPTEQAAFDYMIERFGLPSKV